MSRHVYGAGFAFLALVFPARLWAQEGDSAAHTDGGRREVLAHSIVAIGQDQYRAWVRTTEPSGNKLLEQEDFDCSRRRWRLIRTTGYDAGAIPTGNTDHSKTAKWTAVDPGSTSARDLEAVCKIAKRNSG